MEGFKGDKYLCKKKIDNDMISNLVKHDGSWGWDIEPAEEAHAAGEMPSRRELHWTGKGIYYVSKK